MFPLLISTILLSSQYIQATPISFDSLNEDSGFLQKRELSTRQTKPVTKVCDLGVVATYGYWMNFQGLDLKQYIKDYMNEISGHFEAQVGISLNVSKIIIINSDTYNGVKVPGYELETQVNATKADKQNFTVENIIKELNQFALQISELKNLGCGVHFLTGLKAAKTGNPGVAQGNAWDSSYKASMICGNAFYGSRENEMSTSMHELAHRLHDQDDPKYDSDYCHGYMMGPDVWTGAKKFQLSPCSIRSITAFVNAKGELPGTTGSEPNNSDITSSIIKLEQTSAVSNYGQTSTDENVSVSETETATESVEETTTIGGYEVPTSTEDLNDSTATATETEEVRNTTEEISTISNYGQASTDENLSVSETETATESVEETTTIGGYEVPTSTEDLNGSTATATETEEVTNTTEETSTISNYVATSTDENLSVSETETATESVEETATISGYEVPTSTEDFNGSTATATETEEVTNTTEETSSTSSYEATSTDENLSVSVTETATESVEETATTSMVENPTKETSTSTTKAGRPRKTCHRKKPKQ